MKKIHILGRRKSVYWRHLHPIRLHSRALSEIGMNVEYFSDPRVHQIEDCDALIFMEGSFSKILPIKEKDTSSLIDYLQGFLSKFKKIVWFDDHDSSGMLRTYVFPLVDTYAKSQLMVNRNYYQEEHLTGVAHRDFVNEQYGINDESRFKGAITDSDISKLRSGWNLGMVNWDYWKPGSKPRKLYNYFSPHKLVETNTPRLSARPIHVTSRLGMSDHLPTVHWWRKTTNERLRDIHSQRRQFNILSEGKVSLDVYYQEMGGAMVSPSPFGVGEICYRDFECFLNGSLLFKPRMDHLESYPNLYIDGETYIAHEWDFTDFEDKLLEILSDPLRYEPVAREGQRRFIKAFNDGPAFARRFKALIEDEKSVSVLSRS